MIIDAKTIAAEVRAKLREYDIQGEIWIELDRRQMEIHLPLDTAPSIGLRHFRFDRRTRRFSATIEAPADAPQVLKPLAGQAHEVMEVPVLKHRIKKGKVIRDKDIEWVKMRADRVGRNVIVDTNDLVGKAPRRLLAAGKLVRNGDIRTPVVIRRGSMVTMTYRTKLMSLTARGRALEDGGPDEVIRVMNSQSNKAVEARVVNADTVAIEALSGLAQNN